MHNCLDEVLASGGNGYPLHDAPVHHGGVRVGVGYCRLVSTASWRGSQGASVIQSALLLSNICTPRCGSLFFLKHGALAVNALGRMTVICIVENRCVDTLTVALHWYQGTLTMPSVISAGCM